MRPIIFDEYPGLEAIPWVELGDFPTPVERLADLGREMSFPSLWVKRDDRSSSVYGGNKVRKLEWVLADARAKGRRSLLAVGGTGSNQVLATAIYGKSLGFDVTGLVFDQPNADYVRRNLLLDHRLGVKFRHAPNTPVLLIYFAATYAVDYITGGKPYYVPAGASSPVGGLGYVNAAFEIMDQVRSGVLPEPDYVVVAAGSLGTASGLQLGFILAGMKTKVVAVKVSMPWYITAGKFSSMIGSINDLMRSADGSVPKVRVKSEDLIIPGDYLGRCYAAFTPECVSMLEKARVLEGLSLDPTYTSKALAGGLDWLGGRGEREKVILFLDTYNSVDISKQMEGVNYRGLPRSLRRYFEEPTQEEEQAEVPK